MLFNSYEFICLYFPVVLFGFFWIARNSHRMASLWLASSSLFFYGWWNYQFVLLLLASIGFNYAMGYVIGYARANSKGANRSGNFLVIAVSVNLVLLGYFKYANFFISTANQLAGSDIGLADIVLPLGISFFTFTQIAFLVDVHRGIAREYNFIHYLLFVTYFPHLIAGPVLHHKQMMPQFGDVKTYRIDIDNINIGLTIFIIGLFKKVILADQFALYSNPVFDAVNSGGEPRLVEAWMGSLAYTLQLYFDFSGYSDMAIGLSRMFNVRLPLNFDSPYRATSIIDFWRRWHMTLSAFLRDYLYIALGGNRRGMVRRYGNLLATMLLGGLWHGANWTFVIWGGLHGLYLVINHLWQGLCRKLRLPGFRGSRLLSGAITFAAVVVAWVPFRAENFDSAIRMLSGMFGMNGVSLPASLEMHLSGLALGGISFEGLTTIVGLPIKEVAFWLPLGLAIVWLLPNTQQWISPDAANPPRKFGWLSRIDLWRPTRITAILLGASFAISTLGMTRASQFLYFQF